MFEKLKEYALYIILWLIALWALAYAYLSVTNANKGKDILSGNNDAIIMAISRSDKVKSTRTIASDILDINGWQNIGKMKIDADAVTFVNGETYEDIYTALASSVDFTDVAADVEAGELRTILVTSTKGTYTGSTDKVVNFNSDWTIKWATVDISDATGVKAEADELKGYEISAIWYGFFDNEDDAKEFRNTYFNTYEVYKTGDAKYIVLGEYEMNS